MLSILCQHQKKHGIPHTVCFHRGTQCVKTIAKTIDCVGIDCSPCLRPLFCIGTCLPQIMNSKDLYQTIYSRLPIYLFELIVTTLTNERGLC